jgi:hypothetical protein
MHAPATRRAYESDERMLDAWRAQHGHTAVTPETVGAYFQHCRRRGRKAGSIGRAQAAFVERMQREGRTLAEIAHVRQAGRDARHAIGATKATPPLLLDAVRAMLAAWCLLRLQRDARVAA